MPTAKDIVCCKCGCLKTFSNGIVAGLELLFYKLGGLVARNPWKTIVLCVLVCGLVGIGLIKWHEEKEYVKVWLPRGSRMHSEYEWVKTNFPDRVRFESLVIEDENVLSPESINAMFDVYNTARNFKTTTGETMAGFCVKAGPICRVNSILELWYYNEQVIRNLTEEDIYRTVNQAKIVSPLYQNELNLEKMLGHVRRNSENKIVGANAATIFWFLERNSTTESAAMDWEKQLIHLANDVRHPHLQNLYIYTARTFDDEALGALSSDVNLLTIGFSLVFIYLALSIGQFSLIHHKVLLALAGLLSIGMAIIFTYGFGFITGIMFGPIHQITPFMLLGIGVDDIFVIMESLNHLTADEKKLPVDGRIAYTMKHAGVSITVTSVTDIVAFAIGSSTVIPSLSTFCIYAAIGVFALYILQSTFFVACLSLDEKRQDSRRNACILCYKHQDTYTPNECYTFSIQHQFMKKVLGPALTKSPMKVIVILVTVGLTSLNIWSFLQLKHDFDPSMYLPSDSYSQKYVAADRKYFPDDGAFVKVFCGEADYPNNMDKLLHLYTEIRQKATVQSVTVDFWLASYQRWLNSSNNPLTIFPYEHIDASNLSSVITAQFSDGQDAVTKDTFPFHSNASEKSPAADTSESITTSSEVVGESFNRSISPVISFDIPINSSDVSFDESTKTHMQLPSSSGGISYSSNFSESQGKNAEFFASLGQFLQTPQGRVYSRAIKLDDWARPTKIMGSVMTFRHVKCQSSKCNIDAMTDMRDLVDSFTFRGGGTCFVYSNPQYMFNETNMVLKLELYRNLALAAICVFVVTLILITNIWTSMLVFVGVVCTVIDVAGTMWFWDISVDTASSVILILCFGLAVDYSAHIGHSFMTKTGSRNERLKNTLVSMGPAVFSGGFSTFLAFLLLVNSTSYGFTLFFRIFTSVVVFGLFHGLAFLPVILSIVGPPPYETQIFSKINDQAKQNGNTNSAMLPNGHGDGLELQDFPFKEFSDDVTPNGILWPSMTEEDLDEDPSQKMNDKNQRYSGSYYEQLSNGSLVQIPFPGPH